MARIDVYVRSMERFAAEAMVLKSGECVQLRFSTGNRHATQTTTHEQLIAMVLAIANERERAAIDQGFETQIAHAADGREYNITVQPDGDAWTVIIEPGLAAAAATASSEAIEIGDVPLDDASLPTDDAALRSDRWIDRTLAAMRREGASDLHVCAGATPFMRVAGELSPLPRCESLQGEWLEKQLAEILPAGALTALAAGGEVTFAYEVPGIARFRVNAFTDRLGPGAVFHAVPLAVPAAESLALGDQVLALADEARGLLLIGGPAGAGKTTTIAALLERINSSRRAHIVTIEEPIEFLLATGNCLINQREVGTHTESIASGLRAALREDPDIIYASMLPDPESIRLALDAAESGCLVLASMPTPSVPSAIDWLIDRFPAEQHDSVRTLLARVLRGAVAQALCRKNGGGQVVAREVLFGSSAAENLIRERKSYQLFSLMQTGRSQGMCTLADSLIDLVKRELIAPQEAMRHAVNKAEFKNQLGRAGHNL